MRQRNKPLTGIWESQGSLFQQLTNMGGAIPPAKLKTSRFPRVNYMKQMYCVWTIMIALSAAFITLFILAIRIDKLEVRVNKLYEQRIIIDKTYATFTEDRGYDWSDDGT